jgi:cytochrome d ubiquinol oxidase subunit II
LFTAFPPAFARIGIELHLPITLLLIGIVLRGSAFVFRQYGNPRWRPRWGPVFAVSSLIATLFLGIVLGAMTGGGGWLRVFPIAVGVLAVAAFALLAAAYLTVELTDEALRADFRVRAIAAASMLAVVAFVCAVLARHDAPAFARRLFGAWVIAPIFIAGALALVMTLVGLYLRRYRLARLGAIATVALLVVGWAVGHYPMLVAPDLTLSTAAAPTSTLRALVPIVLVGTTILIPSLWWLLRVFKRAIT